MALKENLNKDIFWNHRAFKNLILFLFPPKKLWWKIVLLVSPKLLITKKLNVFWRWRIPTVKLNLYASERHPDMNQTWLFVCGGKNKISCWAFLVGHQVQILKLSYQDMNKKCKAAQTNQIHFLQDLTQICTQKYNQKCNQLLNFPVH